MDDHALTPEQALVILVRSRAYEETEEETDGSESVEEMYYSYDSGRSRSATPNRVNRANSFRSEKDGKKNLRHLLESR
jgi:hypothetical protein